MKSRRAIFIFLFITLPATILWLILRQPPEPIYNDHPLSYWLSLYMADDQIIRDVVQSDEAVRHIGTNAIPTLLHLLRQKDSSLKTKWITLLKKQRFLKPPLPAMYLNDRAGMAFSALGPAGSNAVPQLVEIYDQNISTTSRREVLRALGGIGPAACPAATPVLRHALTNSTVDVQCWLAAIAVAQIHQQPDVFVPILSDLLKSPVNEIQVSAAQALAAYGPAARSAIPTIVITILNNPDPQVRQSATNVLEAINPAAAAKAGIK